MAEPEVDDLFKDFEYKVEGKKEPKKVFEPIRKEPIAKKEPEQKPEKKTWNQVERQAIEDQDSRPRQKKPIASIERYGYLAVILILVAYVGIDFSSYHTEKSIEREVSQDITANLANNATKENKTIALEKTGPINNKTAEKPAQEAGKANLTANETKVINETKYSGKVTLTIDSVDTQVTNKDQDLGAINSVVFTITNDRDKALKPVVNVFAYDSKMEKIWEVTSRGKYSYDLGIKAGEKHKGLISLTPKTFKNINLTKNIRLTLNDTDAGYITAVNTEILIS